MRDLESSLYRLSVKLTNVGNCELEKIEIGGITKQREG
jgi:hypothetical protein